MTISIAVNYSQLWYNWHWSSTSISKWCTQR